MSNKKWGVQFTPQEIPPYYIWYETKEQAEASIGRCLNRAGTFKFNPQLVEM